MNQINHRQWLLTLILGLLTVKAALANPPFEMVSSQGGNHFAQVTSAEQLLQLADADEEMVIFDTRSSSQFQRGRIHWAVSLAGQPLTNQLLQKHVAAKTTTIVIYGEADSEAAAKAANFASSAGYRAVYWLKGGWDEWQQKKLSLK